MSLLAELKRRNVIRMACLYFAGAWLITQAASTLLPTFEAPAWVLRVIVLVLALGFVPALRFAWVYEITPEGIRRESVARQGRRRARSASRRRARRAAVRPAARRSALGLLRKLHLAPDQLAAVQLKVTLPSDR